MTYALGSPAAAPPARCYPPGMIQSFRRASRCALTLAVLPLIPACSDDEQGLKSLAVDYSARAAEVRELAMLRDVPITSLTQEELEAREEADAEEKPQEEIDQMLATYGRLGRRRTASRCGSSGARIAWWRSRTSTSPSPPRSPTPPSSRV